MFIIDDYEVRPPAAAEQLFASDYSRETVPASAFADKIPVVSGLFDVCVVQLVDTSYAIPSFLSLVVCMCVGEG